MTLAGRLVLCGQVGDHSTHLRRLERELERELGKERKLALGIWGSRLGISLKTSYQGGYKAHGSGHDNLPELQVRLVGYDADVVEGLSHELSQLLRMSADPYRSSWLVSRNQRCADAQGLRTEANARMVRKRTAARATALMSMDLWHEPTFCIRLVATFDMVRTEGPRAFGSCRRIKSQRDGKG